MPKRKLTDEQILEPLKEAEKGERSVSDLCRQYNISDATFYKLKSKYQGNNTPMVVR